MALILDGKKARDFYKARLAERVKALGFSPRLAIVQVGDNPESAVYIEQKKRFGASIGATVDHIKLPDSVGQADLVARIAALNADPSVHGIIVQLPVPVHIDKLAVINSIDPAKDVDGLTDENQRRLEGGRPGLVPATARGVVFLLDFYGIDVKGKRVAVFGRSRLVGHPAALLLASRGAEVSVIHSKTPDPDLVSREADIVVVAIGKPRYVGPAFVKKGAVVVDVGVTSVEGKLVGDTDFTALEGLVSAISPVPGGVGPMTVLSLFDTLVSTAERITS